MGDEIKVCPDCLSSHIRNRVESRGYYCADCQHNFRDPETRPRQGHRNGHSVQNDAAKALKDLDPDTDLRDLAGGRDG